MKKTIYFSALAAAMLLAACSSDDLIEEEPQLGEPVKAQFTISFPLGANTRQSATIVQEGAQTNSTTDLTKFRGIDNIKLFPSAVAANAFSDGSTTTASAIGAAINLTQMLKPTQQTVSNYIIGNSGSLVGASNSVLYGDVQLSSGTQTFLFYGKAIDVSENQEISTAAQYFKYGTLTPSASFLGTPTDVTGFSFTPKAITTANNTSSNTKRGNIINYLNSIKNATDGTTAWSGSNYNSGLESLYTKFIGMTAGSSTNLQAAIEDLYNAVKDNSHTVAQNIKTRIAAGDVTITLDNTTNLSTVTFGPTLSGYPSTSDNLPDGAARLTFTSGSFAYAETSASSTSLNVTNIEHYVYPANLYYWVMSNIVVSKTSQAANYDGNKNWATITGGYTDGTAIASTTRSVALVQPVQYGVGRLDIKVVGSATTLDDNGLAKGEETAKSVNLSDLKLTGILIGGQKAVDWKFEPTGSTEYTVYDNIVASQELTATAPDVPGLAIGQTTIASAPYLNHTLVLETAGSESEVVNVALEFVNTGDDFWGKDGIVAKGTKFYLVGKLSISESTDTAGKTRTGNKVFKQDYKTLAHFTITDLKKAENTIPDLRNPAIELGLSVNLEWQEGITFTQTF